MGRCATVCGTRSVHVAAVAGAALLGLVLAAPGARADATSPTVAGEAAGGGGRPVVATTSFDLGSVGYEHAEYLLTGTATSYAPVALPPDGTFEVSPAETATYGTRVVVYRPRNPRRFNGNVLVEWLNVSGGVDAGPDWVLTHTQLVRQGAAWVGVSAQKVGLDATVGADPVRYAGIPPHPGDSFSYDIFSQAGQAVRDHPEVLLDGLEPEYVLAMGESQSAARLVTYIDAVHPLVEVYDGFLVHSRSATGSALSQSPQPTVTVPSPTPIRGDLTVPVFVVQTEGDVVFSNLDARQPDTEEFRLWEVPGTAHYDHYGLAIGPGDTGDGQGARRNLEAMQNPTRDPSPRFSCDLPINTGPMHWVMNAAVGWLQRWVEGGSAPPTATRLQTTGVSPVVFAVDAHGNVLGGVRTPYLDAPIAVLGGGGNSGSGPVGGFCRLFGNTVPFTPEQLGARYGSHGKYVSAFNMAADDAKKKGFLLAPDARELKIAAARSGIAK